MADLDAVLRALGERARDVAHPDPRAATEQIVRNYILACRPALIEALVEVVMAADVFRRRFFPDDGSEEKAVSEAFRRLETVAQQLKA